MSIRWRLALLYAAGTGALLLLVSLVAYGLHSREQYEGLDESLVTTAEHFMRNRASAETGAGPALERLESDVFVRVYGSGNGAGPSEAPDPALTPLEVLARDDGPASPALAGYQLACRQPQKFAARCSAAGIRVKRIGSRYAAALPAALGGVWVFG